MPFLPHEPRAHFCEDPEEVVGGDAALAALRAGGGTFCEDPGQVVGTHTLAGS